MTNGKVALKTRKSIIHSLPKVQVNYHSFILSLQVYVVRRQVKFLHVGHRGEVEEPRGAHAGDCQGADDDSVGVRGDQVTPAVEDLFQ